MSSNESTDLQFNDILIVDDNIPNLKLLSDLLKNEGYLIRPVTSGKLALRSIKIKLPTLILLDVMMPEMDGFEVCRIIQADERTRNIPVIFISALDDEESKLTGFQSGGVDYISKPIRKEEVLARVKTHLSLFRMQFDLKARNEKLEEEIVRRKQAELAIEKRMIALTQPFVNPKAINFGELFNLAELQKLQDQFAYAFGVGSIITQTDGSPITKPSNFSRLCQNIIRCTEKGLKNCMYSDSVIGRHNPDGPIVMPCLSGGLWDAGASIAVNGKHIANWMIGQVRNEVQDENALKEYARKIGADEADFMSAFYEITPMSSVQFQKISEMLFTMASQLSDMAYQNVQQARFINDRRIAEEALLESEERFRTTLYSIGDGVITTDTKGRVKLMNPVAEQLTGWSQAEASGKQLEKVFQIIHEGTRTPAEVPVRQVLRKKITVGMGNHILLISKNGNEHPIADIGAPIRNENGQLVGVVLVFRDQTEERKAENRLRKFKMGIDHSADGIFITNMDGTIEYINHAFEEIYGYHLSEVIGKTPRILKSGLYSREYYEQFWNKLLTKKAVVQEIQNKAKDGRLISVETTNNPILDDNGQTLGFISINRDITERKQAENKIHEAEEKMNAFFEQSLDGFFFMMLDQPIEWSGLVDKDQLLDYIFSHQRITRINDAMLQNYGATRDQLLGKTPMEIFAHDLTHGKNVWRRIFDNGKIHIETDQRKLNGEQIILEGDYTCLYDSSGWITGHFGIQRDITKDKLVVETIKNERKLLRTLIDHLPDPIYVKDIDGRKIVANISEVESRCFLNEAEVLGKTDYELFDGEIGLQSYSDDLKVIQNGEAVLNRDEVIQDKNGLQHWFSTSKIPLFDQRGKVTGLVGIGRDITEQKKANETIQKLTKSIEQSPSTIIITDTNGNIEYVNSKFTEITGYFPEEVIGKNPNILKSGLMSAETYSQLWKSISAGDIWRGEFLNRRKNGELYWEWATMTSIKNDNGLITNYIAIKEDISARKKMEADLIIAKEKAEENDRLKSAFLANMSHEIRTPLNSIIGFSELLADPDFESDQIHEFAALINASGNNLLEIISAIMDISKIETGQIKVNRSVFPARKLIENVQKEYEFRMLNKEIYLKFDLTTHSEDYLIESDESKLKQVLINFVGNAVKFTEKGVIEIGMKAMDNAVRFFVKDTGIGIPLEDHDRIFERFSQVEGFSTRKYGGNGLGLAISKSLIELLGGNIGMESEPGKGSTFYFTIPIGNVIAPKTN